MKKKIVRIIVVSMIIFCAYLGNLFIGHLIPIEWISSNGGKSYVALRDQGSYYHLSKNAYYDNWTDSFFINAALTDYDKNIVKQVIANAYTVGKGAEDNPIECIPYIWDGSLGESYQQPYSRYWAGYYTIFKIMMIFMPINEIRSVLMMVTITLLSIILIKMNKTLGVKGIIPFLIMIFAYMYVPMSMCLTFSSDIIIMLLGMIICMYLIQKNKTNGTFYATFAIIGSFAAYISYWSFPLITLGVPLVYWTIIKKNNGIQQKEIIKTNLITSISWAAGLFATIATKQILSLIILGEETGFKHMEKYSGAGKGIDERVMSTINGTISEMMRPEIITAVVIGLIIGILIMCCKKNEMQWI